MAKHIWSFAVRPLPNMTFECILIRQRVASNGLLQFAKRNGTKRRNVFFGGNFLFRISKLTQRERIYVHFANYRFSFRKLQILISQTTDSHFANYRFSFRKLQIPISQTTDSHFANYRFPFCKLQISISQTTDFHFVSFHFVSQSTVSRKQWRI